MTNERGSNYINMILINGERILKVDLFSCGVQYIYYVVSCSIVTICILVNKI